LPDSKDSYKKVLKIAKEIKVAREKNDFVCPKEAVMLVDLTKKFYEKKGNWWNK